MRPKTSFDSISPIDYRYFDESLAPYFSDRGFLSYKIRAEIGLLKALEKRNICPSAVVEEVEKACASVTSEEVYEEEEKIRHDIRALVNVIRSKVSDSAKPYVHMTATSYDIIDTANAARFRDAVQVVLVPALKDLEKTLIMLTLREAETVQVGRTHGQHAVPITFGFALSGYVSRLGVCIEALEALAKELKGKFSGAVGAYNASSLFFDDPESFEKDVLSELGLEASEQSTQVTQPEPMTRLMAEVSITLGVLANLSDDMRALQRSEIGEIGEEFGKDQVGSSTMPQKRNPINFENVKSLWKIVMPRTVTVFLDQISEHQRDLTNSASSRTYGESIAYTLSATKRLQKTFEKLSVDKVNLEKNLALGRGSVAAEPLYILLASLGHPDAHEKVRNLTLTAQSERKGLEEVALSDADMIPYLAKMTDAQKDILKNPSAYTGISAKKAKKVAENWTKRLSL
ncbi:adenylosuccinate lyase [Patescibacteria group bacterium]|nr:MAG: adenylosuccinate lyase [Patescibacteria group bacterium]